MSIAVEHERFILAAAEKRSQIVAVIPARSKSKNVSSGGNF
jgi:hypothetical protein